MEKETKYISVEVNQGVHFKALSDVLNFLFRLSQELHKRMKDMEVVGRTLTVKLTVRRSHTLRDPTSANGKLHNDQIRSVRLPHETGDLGVIRRECKNLLLQMHASPADIIGVGVQVSRLQSISGSSKFCKTLKEWHGVKTDVARDNAAGKNPSADLTTGNKGRKSYSLLDYIKPKKREIQSNLSSSQDKKRSEETRTAAVSEESDSSTQTGDVKCDDKNISNEELMKDIDKAHMGNVATITDPVTVLLNDKCSNAKTVSIKQKHLIPSPPQQSWKENVRAMNLDRKRLDDVSVGGVKSHLAHCGSENQKLGGRQTFTDRQTMNDWGAAGSARGNSQGDHSKRSKTDSESTSVSVTQIYQSRDVALCNSQFSDQECLSYTDKTTHFPAVSTKHSKTVLFHCQENHSGSLKSDPGIMMTSECLAHNRCSKGATQTEHHKQGEVSEKKPDHTALVDSQHFESIENLIQHGNQTHSGESKKGSDSTAGVCLPDGNCTKDMIQYGKNKHPSGSDEISHSTLLANAKVSDCNNNGNQNNSGGSQKDSNGTATEDVPHVDCRKDEIGHGRQENVGGSNETISSTLPSDTKVSCSKGVVHDNNQKLLGGLHIDKNGTTIEHVPHADCKKDEIQNCKQKHVVGSNETIYSTHTQPMDTKLGDCTKGVIHGSHQSLSGESQEDSCGTTMEHAPHVGCEKDEMQHRKQKCASGSSDSSGNTTLVHSPSFDCAKIAAHHGSKHSSGSNSSTVNTPPLHTLKGEHRNTVTHKSKHRHLGGSEKSTTSVVKAHAPHSDCREKVRQHRNQKHAGEQNISTENILQLPPQCGDGINVTMHHHDGLRSSKSLKNTDHMPPLQPPHDEVKTGVTHYDIQRHFVGPEKSTGSAALHDCNTDTVKHRNHEEPSGQTISPNTTTVEHVSLGDCSKDVCQKSSSRTTASTNSSELDHALHGKCHKDVINQGNHNCSTGSKKMCDSASVAHALPPDHRKSLIHQKSSSRTTTSTDSSKLEHALHDKCCRNVINQGNNKCSTGSKKMCDSASVRHASPPDHRKSLIHQKSSSRTTTSTDSSELDHALHGKYHKNVINQGKHNCSTGSKKKCDSAPVSRASPPDHKKSVIHHGNHGHPCGSEKSIHFDSSLKAHPPHGDCRKDSYQKHQDGQSKCNESFSQVLAQPGNGNNIMAKDGHRVRSCGRRMSPNSTAMAHVSHGDCRKDVSQKSSSRMQMSINRSDRDYVPHGSCRKDGINQSDKKCSTGSKNCDSTAAIHATDVDRRKSVNSDKQKHSVGSKKKSDGSTLAYFSRRGCSKDVTMHENQRQSCRSTKSFDSGELTQRGTRKHSSGLSVHDQHFTCRKNAILLGKRRLSCEGIRKSSHGRKLSVDSSNLVHAQRGNYSKDMIHKGNWKHLAGSKKTSDSTALTNALCGDYNKKIVQHGNQKISDGSTKDSFAPGHRSSWYCRKRVSHSNDKPKNSLKILGGTTLPCASCDDFSKKVFYHDNQKYSSGSKITTVSMALANVSCRACRKNVGIADQNHLQGSKAFVKPTGRTAVAHASDVIHHGKLRHTIGSKKDSDSPAMTHARSDGGSNGVTQCGILTHSSESKKNPNMTTVTHTQGCDDRKDLIHSGDLTHSDSPLKTTGKVRIAHVPRRGRTKDRNHHDKVNHTSGSKKNPHSSTETHGDSGGDHKDLVHSRDVTHSDSSMKTTSKVRLSHVPRRGCSKDRIHHDKLKHISELKKDPYHTIETHRDSDHKDFVYSGDLTHSDFSIKTTGKVRIAHVPRRGCSKDRIHHDKLKHTSELKKDPYHTIEIHRDSGGDHKDLVHSGDVTHSDFSIKTTGKGRIAHVPRRGCSKDIIHHDKLKRSSESKKNPHSTTEMHGNSGGDHMDLVRSGDLTHSDFPIKTTRKVRIAHVPRRGCSKDIIHHNRLTHTSESKKNPHCTAESHGDSGGDHKDLVHSGDLTHSDFSKKTTGKVRIAHVPRSGGSKHRSHHDKLEHTSKSKKIPYSTTFPHGASSGDHKDLFHSGDLKYSDVPMKTTGRVRLAHVPRSGCSKHRNHHDKLDHNRKSEKNPYSTIETHIASDGSSKDVIHSGNLKLSDGSNRNTGSKAMAHVPSGDSKVMICHSNTGSNMMAHVPSGESKDMIRRNKLKHFSRSRIFDNRAEAHVPSNGGGSMIQHGDQKHSSTSSNNFGNTGVVHVQCGGDSNVVVHHGKQKCSGGSKKSTESKTVTHVPSDDCCKIMIQHGDQKHADGSKKITDSKAVTDVPSSGFSKDVIYCSNLKLSGRPEKSTDRKILSHMPNDNCTKDVVHPGDLKYMGGSKKTFDGNTLPLIPTSNCSKDEVHIMVQPDGSTEDIKNLLLDATHDVDSDHSVVSEKKISTCKADQPTELSIMKKVHTEKRQNHPNGFPNGIENVLPTRNHSGNKSVWIPVIENKSQANATSNPKTRPKLQSGSSVKQESGNLSPDRIIGNDHMKEVFPLVGFNLKDDGAMASNRSSKTCDTSQTECGGSEQDSQRYQQKAGSQSSAGSVKTEKKRKNLRNKSTSHVGFKDGFNPEESQVDPHEPSTFDSKNRNECEGRSLSEESIFRSLQDELDLQRLPTGSNIQQVSDSNSSMCGSRIVSSPNKIGLDSCGEGPSSTNVPGNKKDENLDGSSVTRSSAVTSSQKTFLKYSCKSEPQDGCNPESCPIGSTMSATSHQDTKCQEVSNSTAKTKPLKNCGSLSQKGLPCTNSQFVKPRTSQGKAAQRVYINFNDYIGSQKCAKSLAKDDSSSNGLKRSSQLESAEANLKDTGLAMYSSPAKKTRHAWHVVDPNFISDFYSKSSFHHLSTWRVEHKVFVNNLQKVQKKFPGKEKLQMLMDASKRKVNAGEREINTTKSEVITAEREMNTTKTEVDVAGKKVNATKLEGDAAEREINPAKQEVNAAEREINKAKGEMNATKGKMNDAKGEVNAAEREMNDPKGGMNAAKGEMNNAKEEVNAPENEMNTAKMEGNPSEREELQENQKPRVPSGYALPSTHMVIQERGINCTKMFGEKSMIMHIDMDCFFVSVSLLNYPELRGMAVAVTGRPKVRMSQKTDSWSEDFEQAHLERRKWTSSQAKSLEMIPRGENSQQNSSQKEGIAGVTSDEEIGDGKIGIGEENPVSGKRNADNKQDSSNSSDEEEVVYKDASDGMDIVEEKTSDAGDGVSDVKMNIIVGTDEPCNPVAEVASCSYEARAFGVEKGMMLSKAKELCPHLLTVPYDFESYYRVSRILYETVASFTNEIEAISCDDMFVDITKILKDTGATPFQFAQLVVDEIFAKTQCTASVGIASNPLLAKLCIRIAKPNGIYVLEDHQVDEFMRNVPVKSLPGVGLATNQKLASLGIRKCSELQELSLASLQSRFGQRLGQDLYQNCRGQSDHAIKVEREVKVVSSTVNFGIRFASNAEAEQFVSDLAQVVHRKLKKTGMAGRSIVLKLKIRRSDSPKYANDFLGHGLCDNKCRTKTLKQETDDLSVIQRECQNLFLLMKAPAKDIRGVGVLIMRLKKASASSDCTQSLKDMLVKKGSSSAKTSEFGKTLAAVAGSPGPAKKNSEIKKPPQSVTKKADKKRTSQYPILEMFSTITKKQSQNTGRESTTQSPVETEANQSNSENRPGKGDKLSPVIEREPRSPSPTEREVNQRSLPENFQDKSDSVSPMIKQEPRWPSSFTESEVTESSDPVNFPEKTDTLSSVITQKPKSKSVIECEVSQSSLSVNFKDKSDILLPFAKQERKSPSATEVEVNQRTLSVNFPEKSDSLSLVIKQEPVLPTVVESEVNQCYPSVNFEDRSDTPPPFRRQEPNSQSLCDSEENQISQPVSHPYESDALSPVIKQEPMSPSAADSEVNQSSLPVSISDISVVPSAVIKQEPKSPTVMESEANQNCSPVNFPDERDQSTKSASPLSAPSGTFEPFLRPVSMFGPVPNRSFKRALSTGDMPSEYPPNLDPDVLKELPPHIREEVLEEERLKATKGGNLVGALGHVEELPLFSNIDPTCMDALPKEVQGELIAAYRKKGTLTFQETAKRSPERTPEKRAFQEESKVPERIKKKKCSNSRMQSVSHSGKTSVQRKLFEVMNIHPSKDKQRRHSVL